MDLVIVLKDYIGHPDHAVVKANAKRARVDCLSTLSKWSTMYQGLWTRGFRKAELPLEVCSSAIMWETSPGDDATPAALVADAERARVAAVVEEPRAKVLHLPRSAVELHTQQSARLLISEDQMMISVLIAELQRRLQEPSCIVKAVMLTGASSSIEYKEAAGHHGR